MTDSGSLASIALFVYNRPEHARRTLEALSANSLADSSTLHVFCDGPAAGASESDLRRIDDVRQIVGSRAWCKEVVVHVSDENLGLATSIRSGIDWVLTRNDRIIVLEDDIVTSTGFLRYMNDALRTHEASQTAMHIAGYLPGTSGRSMLPETFFARYMSCWGWATWARAWHNARWDAGALLHELESIPGGREEFDLDGTADFSFQLEANRRGSLKTWAVFWAASIYLTGGLCLFPRRSLVRNIGVDGTGEHFRSDRTPLFDVELGDGARVEAIPVRESRMGRYYLKAFHRYGSDSGPSARARRSVAQIRRVIARYRHPSIDR